MTPTVPPPQPERPAFDVRTAPLVPIAVAATAGIVADRYLGVPLVFSLTAAVACLVAWWCHRTGPRPMLGLLYLCVGVAAAGAAHHHAARSLYAADDIGAFASAQPRLVRVEGVLAEEPHVVFATRGDPLVSLPHTDSTTIFLETQRLQGDGAERPVSGNLRVLAPGRLTGVHVNDRVSVTGWLSAPHGPGNPGEWDPSGYLLDRRVRAELRVHGANGAAVVRVAEGWPRTLTGWLVVLRGWSQRALERTLPPRESAVATALLLGEGAPMTASDWDKYVRTGVIHVLAISGQHLVVLGAFLWMGLRLLRVRQRRGAVFVAGFLFLYALMTGGRPAAMRSAVMVAVVAGGLWLRRPAVPANSFALAWLVILLHDPTDLFSAGCQLSFLAVAVLVWGVAPWMAAKEPPDPLERLIEETRPRPVRLLRALGRAVAVSYAVNAAVALAVMPLAAAWQQVVSPSCLLIGPPLVLLTSVALIAGFLLLVSEALGGWLSPVLALPVRLSLAACEWLVDGAERLPGGFWYVGEPPAWWLAGFYLGLAALLVSEAVRRRWRALVPAGLTWCCVGLLAGAARPVADELRVTFLAVGHGGCTVLETPDGRVFLYDVGALSGPDVARRQIAPYLWSRGIRRIDEVFLSHADLDHFNGMEALFQRFVVKQVTATPSFADKPAPGVQRIVGLWRARGVPVRHAQAGDRFHAGEVELDVLHPPAEGPDGVENVRSLVLLVRHAGHTVLLTGDLEGPGLAAVLARPVPPIDVMMAPHHGSKAANVPALAEWARPRVTVACQGPPAGFGPAVDPYEGRAGPFLGTWPHGAVTVVSRGDSLTVETFVTRQRLVVR
jgi:competence protein ComEC